MLVGRCGATFVWGMPANQKNAHRAGAITYQNDLEKLLEMSRTI